MIIDLYTVNSIRDIDDDGTTDIVAVHVEERESSRSGHIKLISGREGKLIRTISTPYKEEVFVPIQMITQPDGSEYLLILTGGQNSPGGVYILRISSIMHYTNDVRCLFLILLCFPSNHSDFRLTLESYSEIQRQDLWFRPYLPMLPATMSRT